MVQSKSQSTRFLPLFLFLFILVAGCVQEPDRTSATNCPIDLCTEEGLPIMYATNIHNQFERSPEFASFALGSEFVIQGRVVEVHHNGLALGYLEDQASTEWTASRRTFIPVRDKENSSAKPGDFITTVCSIQAYSRALIRTAGCRRPTASEQAIADAWKAREDAAPLAMPQVDEALEDYFYSSPITNSVETSMGWVGIEVELFTACKELAKVGYNYNAASGDQPLYLLRVMAALSYAASPRQLGNYCPKAVQYRDQMKRLWDWTSELTPEELQRLVEE